MLGGLGAVIAELVNIVEAHHIVVLLRRVLFFRAAAYLGIEVSAALVLYL